MLRNKEFVIKFEIEQEIIRHENNFANDIVKLQEKKIKNEVFNKVFEISNNFKVPIMIMPLQMGSSINADRMSTEFFIRINIVVSNFDMQEATNLEDIFLEAINKILDSKQEDQTFQTLEEVVKDERDKFKFKRLKENLKVKKFDKRKEKEIKTDEVFEK